MDKKQYHGITAIKIDMSEKNIFTTQQSGCLVFVENVVYISQGGNCSDLDEWGLYEYEDQV